MKKSVITYFGSFLIILLISNIKSFSFNLSKDSIYQQTEVQLDTGLNSIYGTLTIPIVIEKIPVVLIIAGSGPTDRNGNNPYGLSTDCYKMLVHGLAEKGIASLRYDKRGVAKSAPSLENEKDLSIGVYVNDAEKWVKWLKKDQRFSKVIILGHSEGALIGTLTTNFQRASGFISISGAATTADSLIIDQLFKQSPALADTARRIIAQIKKGEPFHVNKDLSSIFRPSVVTYLRSWFELSPIVELALLRCPVLVIQGSTDIQVSVSEAKKLADAKPGSRLVIIEKMNHVLKTAPENMEENLSTYRNATLPLATELVPAISDFILNLK